MGNQQEFKDNLEKNLEKVLHRWYFVKNTISEIINEYCLLSEERGEKKIEIPIKKEMEGTFYEEVDTRFLLWETLNEIGVKIVSIEIEGDKIKIIIHH